MFTPIEQRYIAVHPRSAEQYATSKHIFPNGVTHDTRRQEPFPVYVTHAMGPHKRDVDGNRIIDETVDAYEGTLAEVRQEGLP